MTDTEIVDALEREAREPLPADKQYDPTFLLHKMIRMAELVKDRHYA